MDSFKVWRLVGQVQDGEAERAGVCGGGSGVATGTGTAAGISVGIGGAMAMSPMSNLGFGEDVEEAEEPSPELVGDTGEEDSEEEVEVVEGAGAPSVVVSVEDMVLLKRLVKLYHFRFKF